MQDISTINEATLIDLEGIENITKFKYRTTVPLYPKPGTFYWIEQTIEGKPKLGIYFTTNDDELRRLDSKIYELVVKDEDGYIQITEPDVFDKQEIYLIIGNFEKEDELIEDGTPNKMRVFRITKPENQGLATVEATVEYVSDSNNMLYMSNVPDFYKVGIRLGDIRIGKDKEDLKNNTISEILDTIIYPTLQPDIVEPSVSISEEAINNFKLIRYDDNNKILIDEIIEKFKSFDNIKDYVTCSRGELTYVTEELDENGKPYTLKNYSGEPDLNNVNITSEIPYQKLDGTYKFDLSIFFNDGPTPLDNKRQPARYDNKIDTCDCENGCETCFIPSFKGQYIKSNELVFDVVFPIYSNCLSDNIKYIKDGVVEYELLNYNTEEGGVAYMEFPSEIDGDSVELPCKMCLDIPQHLDFKVYQYSEFDKSYDIEVEMEHAEKTFIRYSVVYDRWVRSKNPTNTNVDPVKYKIVIKKQ